VEYAYIPPTCLHVMIRGRTERFNCYLLPAGGGGCSPKFGILRPNGFVSAARHTIVSHDATGSTVSHESSSSEVRCRGQAMAQLLERGVVCC